MKMTTRIALVGIPLSVALVWTAAAQSNLKSVLIPTTANEEKAEAQIEMEARIDRKKAEIAKRVGMSAPLEAPQDGESDCVTEAERHGLIVKATLEEVEAALEAAAATPSKEDDIAAMKLAHFGSYRFFMDLNP